MEKIKTYHIETHGCQMNLSDSERTASLFESFGLKNSPKNKANLVVINSCSVRQSAENKIYGEIINLKKLRPIPKIVVTGCVAARNPKKIAKLADYVLNIKELYCWPKKMELSKKNTKQKLYFSVPAKHSSSFHAYVPISNGCNNFCTYCVVPYSRGREISRPQKEILRETEKLVKTGYKAITLVGQNVNSYGKDLSKKINFVRLLKEIEKIAKKYSPNLWLWFLTSHPKDMSDELISFVGKSKIICPYIHLPIQNGDNEILKKMNRKYTRENYLQVFKKIKNKISDAAFSTDIIVGFPGETKKQFENTVALFKQVKFDMAYIAEYSPRPGTAAARLRDNVSLKEKKRRHQILDNLLKKTSLEKNKKLIGKVVEVLIEKQKNNAFFGKTKTLKTVIIKTNPSTLFGTNKKIAIGDIVKVKITKVRDFALEGKI